MSSINAMTKTSPTSLRVVVTRPNQQADHLVDALTQAGFSPIRFPLLEISPVADPAPLYAALKQLVNFSLVIFVSPNAITQTLRFMMQRGQRWPTQVSIAVLGPGSTRCLADHGIAAPQFQIIQAKFAKPKKSNQKAETSIEIKSTTENQAEEASPRFDSESLLAELTRQGWDCHSPTGLQNKSILLVRGNGGRELLSEQLRSAGANLTIVEAYQRFLPSPSPSAWQVIKDSLKAPNVWLLTSSEAVRNLSKLAAAHLNEEEQDELHEATLIASHARIVETAQAEGFTNTRLSGAGDTQLVQAVQAWQKEQKSNSDTNKLSTTNSALWLQKIKARAIWPIVLIAGLLIATIATVMAYKYFKSQNQTVTANEINVTSGITADAATVQDLQNQIKQLNARLAETQAQQGQFVQQIQTLQPDSTATRERMILLQSDQLVTSIAQQLQLTGNIPQALAALQNIDARLATVSQASVLPVRRALAHDMGRLKALNQVDMAGAAIKLDEISSQIDKLPMVNSSTLPRQEKEPAKPNKNAKAAKSNENIWRLWIDTAWLELQNLVQIRRVDDKQALLATPEQTWFVRETLKLRLLDARVALLSRNEAGFRSDMAIIQDLLSRYADKQSTLTQSLSTSLQQIQKNTGSMSLPTLSESLTAIRSQT